MSNSGDGYDSDVEMYDAEGSMASAPSEIAVSCLDADRARALAVIKELVTTPYLVVKRPLFTFEMRINAWKNQVIASESQYNNARRAMGGDEEQLDVQGEQIQQLEKYVNSERFRKRIGKMTARRAKEGERHADRPTGTGSVEGMHLRHIIPASDICFVWYLCFTHREGIGREFQRGIQEKARVLFGHLLTADEDEKALHGLFQTQYKAREGKKSGLLGGPKNSEQRKELASLLAKVANSPLNLFLSDAAPNMAIGNRPDFGTEARAQADALRKPDLKKLRDAWFELFTLLGLTPKTAYYDGTGKNCPTTAGAVYTVYEHDGSRCFRPGTGLRECFVLPEDQPRKRSRDGADPEQDSSSSSQSDNASDINVPSKRQRRQRRQRRL